MADQLITRTSSSGIWVRGTDVRAETFGSRYKVREPRGSSGLARNPPWAERPGARTNLFSKRGKKNKKIKTRIAQIALMMSPRVPDPLRAPGRARAPRAPPSPEQKRIFAAASRLFGIVTRLPPLNLCDVPRCSETAGQRSSSSRDLSRLRPQSARKTFPR